MNDSHSSFIFQLGNTIQHKQHLTITDSWKSWLKTTGITQVMLILNSLFTGLPFDTERRIRNDIVKFISTELVRSKCITLTHIISITALDQHVCLGDTESLVIQFLTIASNFCFWIYLIESFRKASQHLTGSHGHIINAGCNTFFRQFLFIFTNQEFSH